MTAWHTACARTLVTALLISTPAMAQCPSALVAPVVPGPGGSGPQTMPSAALSGSYVAPTGYPRVYMTKAKGLAMIASTNPSVKDMLKRLKVSAAQYAANLSAYTTPYVGTDMTTEQTSWSQPIPPVALQLAMYAYLSDLNAGYGDSASATTARNAAIAIFDAWSNGGFVDASGNKITAYTQFTTKGVSDGGTQASVELQIGRGVAPWVVGLDMLIADGITAAQTSTYTAFVSQLQGIIVGAANFHYSYSGSGGTGCARYDNQSWQGITALVATGRFLGDANMIKALAGADTGSLLTVSIPEQIEGNFYGISDTPRTCSADSYGKNYTDGSGRQYFQTTVVAPGEIVDRYRAETGHPFGYPHGVLIQATESADVMALAGFDMADFLGPNSQGLQLSLDYYAQYISQYLTPTASFPLPATGTISDFAQYAGDVYTSGTTNASVEGRDNLMPPFVLAQHLYPNDASISGAISTSVSLAAAIPTLPYDVFTDPQGWADWFTPAS